jgi:hypothetical protein
MKYVLLPILLLLAAFTSGCASLEGKIDNNLACTVAKDKLFMVSEWGPVSFGAKIRQADTEAVCGAPVKK